MWLITGGAYQGKQNYALNLAQGSIENIISGETCDYKELLTTQMVTKFHLWIKRMLLQENDVEDLVNQILEKNPKIIIIVDELGCGIVPMDAFDRNYRECVGRICCRLAKEAEEVHLVMCGIGRVIKHA